MMQLGRNVGWEVEEEATGKIGRWRFDCTQDVGRYVYPAREVNDGEKDVGRAEQALVVDEVADMEFH